MVSFQVILLWLPAISYHTYIYLLDLVVFQLVLDAACFDGQLWAGYRMQSNAKQAVSFGADLFLMLVDVVMVPVCHLLICFAVCCCLWNVDWVEGTGMWQVADH